MMKRRKFLKIPAVIFTVFLFLIGLLYAVMPKSDYSETEKRYLQTLPKFSLQRLADGSFTEDFETFLADQTPLRKLFVSVNAYYNYAVGNNGSNGVYLGREGWLIEKPAQEQNRLDVNVERIANFSRSAEVPVSLCVVPEKGFVYGEYLPKNSLEYRDAEYFERIAALVADKPLFVSLSDVFYESRNGAPLFYKTDHHWTSAGAYLAYCEICKKIGLDATPQTDFDIEASEAFFGTSYSTSCYTLTKPDTVEIWRDRRSRGAAQVTITDSGKDTEHDNLFFTENLAVGDKYLTFLGGNHSLVRIKTGNPGGRLLLVKDSFAHCLAPFLARHYGEIVMIDLRYYKKPVSQLIEEERITEVMFVYGMENLAESTDIILK